MPKVRGKFKIGEITQYDWNQRAAFVKLESVKPKRGQRNPFSASFSIMITDPALIDSFPLGEEVYVDFTLVSDSKI